MSEAEAITPFKTTIHWKGFQLTKCHGSNKKTTYRCSYYRRGCKAKIDVMTDGQALEIRFPHSCNGEIIVISSDDSSSGESPLASRRPPPQDVTQQMADETDALALQQVAAPPSQIWEQVREQFTINEMTRGLSRDQVISRVYRARRVHFGGSVHGHVEVPPLSQARDGSNFFQFNYTYAGETRAERVVGWGHPALIRLLTYADISLFVDGTFYCVPSAFYQCVIMMVYDRGSRCYVPVMWVLNTCKTEWSYWHVLHCVQVATGMNMSPGTISCDFEQALINAVGDQFPDSTITGCLFHFKQAIRRRMIKLHISTDEISMAMSRGMLDVLAIIPHEQIDPQGIDYVIARLKADVEERGFEYSTSKWNFFWEYFRRTWLEMFPPKLWNVRGISRQIVNRTNNPLERYNRELNNEFTVRRPSVQTFVGVIERHAHRYLTLIEDIARGRARPPPHGAYYTPPEFTL